MHFDQHNPPNTMSFFSFFSKKKNKESTNMPTQNPSDILSKMVDQDLILQEKLEKLEKEKNLRKQLFLEGEKSTKEYEEDKIRQIQIKNNKDKLIQFLLNDEENTNQIVSLAHKENLHKHEQFLLYLKEVEKTSKELINNTLNFNQSFQMDFNEKYSKCDSIKHIKSNNEVQFIKDEEYSALKLEQIIEEASVLHCIRVNQVSNDSLSEMEKLTSLLNTSNCYRQVLKEHLKSMYNQLKYLTAVELQKQNTQLNKQINSLSNQRITITEFLVDFIDKKKQNQKRLVQELEAQNIQFDITLKWLSQYSKLVNNMPSELTFSNNTINPKLLHRVCTAGGSHLLLFILENELTLPLTKEYLVNMGISSCDDQEILINTLNNFPIPSAPPEIEFSPSAPPETEFSSTFLDKPELECIVCMETQFDVLFVPCGHLCCCWNCSEKIKLCPMCRTEISDKFDVKNIT